MKKQQVVDTFAEQTLDQNDIAWKVQLVPLAQVDWEQSAKNRARMKEPIKEAHVDDLVACIKGGDLLPMPVMRKVGRKYVIMAGNHRCRAWKECDYVDVMAYVIETDDEKLLTVLPSSLNAPVREPARDERTAQAVEAVMNQGMKAVDAGRIFKLSPTTISLACRVRDTRQRIDNLGVDQRKVVTTACTHLGTIKNDNVLKQAAQIVATTKIPSAEVEVMSKAVRGAHTELDQLAVLAKYAKAYRPSPNGRPRANPLHFKIKSAIGSLESASDGIKTVNQWGFTDKEEKKFFIERAERVCKSILAICKRG